LAVVSGKLDGGLGIACAAADVRGV
jgi:hypothetical protein